MFFFWFPCCQPGTGCQCHPKHNAVPALHDKSGGATPRRRFMKYICRCEFARHNGRTHHHQQRKRTPFARFEPVTLALFCWAALRLLCPDLVHIRLPSSWIGVFPGGHFSYMYIHIDIDVYIYIYTSSLLCATNIFLHGLFRCNSTCCMQSETKLTGITMLTWNVAP